MLTNTFIEQDLVTSLRMRLKNTVYKNWYFIQNFTNGISSVIPTFSCHYDSQQSSVAITIDKNRCGSEITDFHHRKEFYMPKIHQALLDAYTKTLSDFVNTPEILPVDNAEEIVSMLHEILNSCQNNICSYKLLDITVILDNTIIVYL